MKRSSLIRLGGIVGAGIVISVLGRMADTWIFTAAGESISGNIDMLVLVAVTGLSAAVFATDRNRDVALADAGARAQALTLAPKEGVAQIIVFRNDRMGARIGVDVNVDDRLHTQLTSPGFTLVELSPGPHRITVDFQGQCAEHALEAAAGTLVALHVKMRMSMTATSPTLEALEPAAARKLIGNAPMALAATASART